MAVSHVKSNIIPDMTGTVTVYGSAGLTQTVAATDLVRPVDWNSAHNQFLTLMGNTAGASTLSGENIVFGGGNNITLSQVNATRLDIVGQNTVAQSTQPVAASGSNGSFTYETITFGNLNGLSFYTSNGSMVGSYTVPAGGNPAISGSNGSFTFNTVTFGALNGLTFYTSNGSVVGSYTVPNTAAALTSQSNQALSGSNGSFTFQTATFGSSNGLHFYTTNGSIVGSYTVPTQSTQPVAASGSNGSFAFSTITFGSSNSMHFYTTNGSMVGSYAQTNQNLSLYAVGNTTSSASSTLLNASNLSFSGMGVASVGMSAGAVIISVPAGGGGLTNINVSAGTTSQNLSNIVFSNSNGVSFGLNGSTVTGSVVAPITDSRYDPIFGMQPVNAPVAITNTINYFRPFYLPNHCAVSDVRIPFFVSVASAANTSSAFIDNSLSVVLYTANGSTLSSINSGSVAISTLWQSNSIASVSGVRHVAIPLASSTILTPGQYYIGLIHSTTRTGAGANTTLLANSVSQMVAVNTLNQGAGANSYGATIGVGMSRGLISGLGVFGSAGTRATQAFSDLTAVSSPASGANFFFELRNTSIW